MELRKTVKNLGSSIVLLIVSLVMWFYLIPEGIKVSSTFGGAAGVTSRTFPYFTAAVIGIISFIQLIVFSFKIIKQRSIHAIKEDTKSDNIVSEIRSIIIYALFIIFVLLFRYFGSIIAMIIVPPLILWVMGSRNLYHYLSVYGFMGVMYLVFRFVLQVYLP